MNGINILGTGSFVPKLRVTNDDFCKYVETSDEWITKRTGMKVRHLSSGEPTWYMGAEAAKNAMADAGVTSEEIDLVLFTSVTADFKTPSMACIAAEHLNIDNAQCIDINCACSGFVAAVDMARRYLATGDVSKVLIISSETLSKITDYTDRSTCVLFGDGAAAAVVTKSEGFYTSCSGSEPKGAGTLYARQEQVKNPFGSDSWQYVSDCCGSPESENSFLHMAGKEVYKFATRIMPWAVKQACEKAGFDINKIDLIIPHQANIRIVETAAQKLGLPLEKVYSNVEKYGNTSSASIPLALNEVKHTRGFKKGEIVCLVGFGAGLTYSAAVFEW